MSQAKNDDFYIGYLDKAPTGIHRFTRKTVIALMAGAVAIALLLIGGQHVFYPSTFEFLQYRTFEGTIQAQPFPMLRVMRPGTGAALPTYSHYYLVNEGKMGAQAATAGFDGQHVQLEGALIYRDDQVMIELKPETLKAAEGVASPPPQSRIIGTYTLTGEIVDSKCFLGVMNPGNHKPHRACATRCISGGIPPLFVVRDDTGQTTYLLLQDLDGAPVNKEILDVVAEPLEITGEVIQNGDILLLKAAPETFRRFAP